MTVRQIKQRIINHARDSELGDNGLYPAHTRNGRFSSFFLVPDPKDIYRITGVLTVEEALQS